MPKRKKQKSLPTDVKVNNFIVFDLAWTGKTGWVRWSTDERNVVKYGEFNSGHSKTSIVQRTYNIYDSVCEVLGKVGAVNDLIVYEYTDWNQSLSRKNWKQKYARERRVQRALGRAEAALLLAVRESNIKLEPYPIGAVEAKREFGAVRKDAVASIVAAEFDRFELVENDNAVLYDRVEGQNISDHIIDSIAIATVVDKRLNLEKRTN